MKQSMLAFSSDSCSEGVGTYLFQVFHCTTIRPLDTHGMVLDGEPGACYFALPESSYVERESAMMRLR